jgi:hypothetical protein
MTDGTEKLSSRQEKDAVPTTATTKQLLEVICHI